MTNRRPKEKQPIPKTPTRSKSVSALAKTVVQSLDDDKAEDIVTIDLRGKSSVADEMVVATGRSARQVGAMADHLLAKLKAAGVTVAAEGMGQGDWVLLDAGDILVHLFRPEVREFYDLEGMWAEAPAEAPQSQKSTRRRA
jgi:ribosome-associated protein